MKKCLSIFCLILVTPSIGWAGTQSPSTYDLVIRGGRVMDPATGFDQVANVGIRRGRVEVIAETKIEGQLVIDARGKVVAPGFVDILADGFTLEGSRYKVMDGVTTQLGMECGPADIPRWYDAMAATGILTNYGATVGHGELREAAGIKDRNAPATDSQLREMLAHARRGIQEGAIGIGFCIQYYPGTSENEVLQLFRLAAEMGVPAHVHTRYLGPTPPENDLKGIQEVIADAAATGVSLQIVHIGSIAGYSMDVALQMISGARAHGVDVMADVYPWLAGSTDLTSAMFDPGWPERMRMTYRDIELLSTGERLSEETFRKYRASKSSVPIIAHFISEEGVDMAMRHPFVMIGTDGGIENGRGHPRGAGTYGMILRKYVREEKKLSLMEALRKMSYLPAQRLEKAAPIMRRKGRLSVGSDADVVVFDPKRVSERSTYQNPAAYSQGFDYVIVNGVIVVSDGKVIENAHSGRAIRGTR